MTKPEIAILCIGALFALVGAFAWAIRKLPPRPWEKDYWP